MYLNILYTYLPNYLNTYKKIMTNISFILFWNENIKEHFLKKIKVGGRKLSQKIKKNKWKTKQETNIFIKCQIWEKKK